MMFGFDETIEYKPSPRQLFKKQIETMRDYIDMTSKRDKKFIDEYTALLKEAEVLHGQLSVSEQNEVNLYWSSVQMLAAQLPTFAVTYSLMGVNNALDSILMPHKGHLISLIGVLS